MKRSRLGPGKKSQERGSTFASRNGLTRKHKKQNPQRRGKQGKRNPYSRGWTQRVFTLYGRRCLVKDCGKKAVQAHHIVPRQMIADKFGEEHPLCYDQRNGFPICKRCHEQHELGVKRIRFRDLPELALEWAEDHGFGWYIEPRGPKPPTYPKGDG